MDRRQFLAATCAGVIASPALASVPPTKPSPAPESPQAERNVWHVPIEAPCNRYARLLPVKKTLGMYLTIQAQELTSHVNNDLEQYQQSGGQWTDAPATNAPEEFRYESFRTRRYDRSTADELARNRSAVAALTLISSPWRAPGNTVQMYAIDEDVAKNVVDAIIRNTFGMVTRQSVGFVWVMNPETAKLYGTKQQIPVALHGIPLVIEDATWKGQHVIPYRDAMLLFRDDVPPCSGPSFSTLTLFMLEDGTAECHRGKDNIVDDFDCKVTAPVSGVYLKAV
jgi:hypothetical protein